MDLSHPAIQQRVSESLTRLRSEGKGAVADALQAALAKAASAGPSRPPTSAPPVAADVDALRAELTALRQSFEVTTGALQRATAEQTALLRRLLTELGVS